MKTYLLAALLLTTGLSMACSISGSNKPSPVPASISVNTIKLPEPRLESDISLEEAIFFRRSVRSYSGEPLTLSEVSQLLWAAQGITADWGGRTAPSAGGLYPLEVYMVAGNVSGLVPGSYKYKPDGHELIPVNSGDMRSDMAKAVLDQSWVKDGAINIVIGAVYERTTVKYGERGLQYVHFEAGHAAQNICLEIMALGLGGVTIGAFYDDRVRSVVGMDKAEIPLYVIPVGRNQ